MRTRRDFLALASLGAASACALAAKPRERAVVRQPPAAAAPIKPRALKPGDTVGLIAPASYTFDLWRLEDAALRVEALGLKPKFGQNVRGRHGFLAGRERERLEDLHAMFADEEVAAVFCLQGGYGTPRLLDGLDYELVGKNPKVLLGYSDITGLHLAIHKKTGLVTFHGPNMLGSLPAWSLELDAGAKRLVLLEAATVAG